jgi:repressor LexA
MINIPLFDSVGCGELMFADPTVQEMIPVKSELMSKGSKYFVLRTSGDSMNLAGINDGDLVLCRKNYHPEEGNNVVALIGDDATIKEYRRENGVVVLRPKSSNPKHKPLRFTNNDEIRVQGVVVCVIKDDYENK